MNNCLLTAIFVAVFLTTPLVSTADEGIPVDGDRVSAELLLPGTIWFTGPRNKSSHVVEHARDFLGREVWQGDAYLAGEMFNSVNWDANFKQCASIPCVGNVTGGNIWGTVRVNLDAFEGGWEAPYKFEISARGLAFSIEGTWFAVGSTISSNNLVIERSGPSLRRPSQLFGMVASGQKQNSALIFT